MELGKIQELKIIKMTDFGARLGDEKENVLLPKREVPEGAAIGDKLEVFICRDSEERLIATMKHPVAQVGEIALMTVSEVNQYGAFLEWGLGKDLFLPYREQTYKVKAGDKVVVRVYTDKSQRLCGSMKIYDYLKCSSEYAAQDMVTGIIYNYNPEYGVFVAVDNKFHGLILKKELTKNLEIGQNVEARVKNVRPDGKLELSLRNKFYLQMDEDAEKIYRFMKDNGGELGYTEKVPPEKIRQDFQMSKSEFKRAIGRLLKERRIVIGENNIFLNK
ncbi:MAG: S1 RNA-binding domain-containing protein [Eubacterium sp.]